MSDVHLSDPVAAEAEALGCDGTDKLCRALYGRPGESRDFCGGSNAQMLYDAATAIRSLTEERDRLQGALSKITRRYPCSTADDMARVAAEAVNEQLTR